MILMKGYFYSINNNNFLYLVVNIEFTSSDDEDDTAELLAELQRIKKERAQEEAKKVGCVYSYKLFFLFFRF